MADLLRIILQSEMFYLSAFGLLAPILALFLTDKIPSINLLNVGIAVGLYLLTLGILRPFIQLASRDDSRGLRTFHLLWFGGLLISMMPFLYILSRDIVDIYVAQILYGVGVVFMEPAVLKIMGTTCNIKKQGHWENFNTADSLLAAGFAAVSGFITQKQGLEAMFSYIGLVLLLTAFIIAALYWRVVLKAHLGKRI